MTNSLPVESNKAERPQPRFRLRLRHSEDLKYPYMLVTCGGEGHRLASAKECTTFETFADAYNMGQRRCALGVYEVEELPEYGRSKFPESGVA